ncbi:MAG: hypothetical protein ACKPKO_52100, partial [Candidatus Fonsibacter sp.]
RDAAQMRGATGLQSAMLDIYCWIHDTSKLFKFKHSLCYTVYYVSAIHLYIFWNNIRSIVYNH